MVPRPGSLAQQISLTPVGFPRPLGAHPGEWATAGSPSPGPVTTRKVWPVQDRASPEGSPGAHLLGLSPNSYTVFTEGALRKQALDEEG